MEENTPRAYSVKTLQKTVEKAIIWDVMALFILSEPHMFPYGRAVTSEYYVTTSCNNNLKQTLS